MGVSEGSIVLDVSETKFSKQTYYTISRSTARYFRPPSCDGGWTRELFNGLEKQRPNQSKNIFEVAFLALSSGSHGIRQCEQRPCFLGSTLHSTRRFLRSTTHVPSNKVSANRSLERANNYVCDRLFGRAVRSTESTLPFAAAIPTSYSYTNEVDACLFYGRCQATAVAASCVHPGHDRRAFSLGRCPGIAVYVRVG